MARKVNWERATRLANGLALVLVAPTAAFCEELLYRGFLFPRLWGWTDSLAWALVISALGFGLAHAYQGFHGMVRSALLGALLTVQFCPPRRQWSL